MINKNSSTALWLLFIPTLTFFYIGLFLTMWLWYPHGLDGPQWRAHFWNFSIVYLLWLIAFFSYQLFDLETLRSLPRLAIRLLFVSVVLIVVAVVYFYFQPSLLITPRRFLLVHVLISSLGISAWYLFMHSVLPRTWQSYIFAHETMANQEELESFVKQHQFLGLNYGGAVSGNFNAPASSLIIFPARSSIDPTAVQSLYALRRQGVRFVEFYDFYESLTRRVHLETLTELWFLSSVDYSGRRWSDLVKRVIDITVSLIGLVLFAVLLFPIALLIKLTSAGPIFFVQTRIGLLGNQFKLYKFRTMTSGGATNTWTEHKDKRITLVGKLLRRLRLDELPQFINIFQGNMSLVGPRPEQVHIVEQLKQQIPYYDERHIVKPGLTGWAQLHVYAGNLEETKQKLQYDLYYIKHRSFLFDLEIILRTIYKVITFSGR